MMRRCLALGPLKGELGGIHGNYIMISILLDEAMKSSEKVVAGVYLHQTSSDIGTQSDKQICKFLQAASWCF